MAEAVTQLWLPLHVALLTCSLALGYVLWKTTNSRLAHGALVLFALFNTAFLAVDGLIVGLRAPLDPESVDALWASPAVSLLADATGALWCAALLARARSVDARPPERVTSALLTLTWLTFVAAALGFPLIASRLMALAAVTWQVYRGGAVSIGSALLVFAAVLRQHVGPEAALGLGLVAAAMLSPRGKA